MAVLSAQTQLLPGLSLVQRTSGTEWMFVGELDEAASASVPFEVRRAAQEDKGLGAFAVCALAPGDLVVAEAPLVMHALPPGDELVPGGQASSEASATEVEALIAGLPAGKRAAFYELCGGDAAHDIWKSNAFRILDEDEGAFIAVFARIARLNHSCQPNCFSTFNDEAKRQTVRALRPIERGEELLINYTGTQAAGMVRDERRELLQRRWGFTCAAAREPCQRPRPCASQPPPAIIRVLHVAGARARRAAARAPSWPQAMSDDGASPLSTRRSKRRTQTTVRSRRWWRSSSR